MRGNKSAEILDFNGNHLRWAKIDQCEQLVKEGVLVRMPASTPGGSTPKFKMSRRAELGQTNRRQS
jgi:hypothetical protein